MVTLPSKPYVIVSHHTAFRHMSSNLRWIMYIYGFWSYLRNLDHHCGIGRGDMRIEALVFLSKIRPIVHRYCFRFVFWL